MIIFPSVADMVASSQPAGVYIETGGYYAGGTTGAGRYFVEVPGTTTPDEQGRAFTLSNGNIAVLQPEGNIRLSQFGGESGWDAFNIYLADGGFRFEDGLTGEVDEDLVIDNPLIMQWFGVTIQFNAFISPSGSFTPGDYLVEIAGDGCRLNDIKLNCNHISRGLLVDGWNSRIHNPILTYINEMGIRVSKGGVDIFNPNVFQWWQTEPEFANDVNFTAVGIQFESSDCNLRGGHAYWCGIPFLSKPTTTYLTISHFHPFNGRPDAYGTNRVDPEIMGLDGTGIHVSDCYLDNGLINVYSSSCTIVGCILLMLEDAVTLTQDRIIAVWATNNPQPEINIDVDCWLKKSTASQIKFFSYEGNDWDAKYNVVNNNTDTGNISVATKSTKYVDVTVDL